ncbi:amino acid adenylation domain-containing protein [Roseateles sp. YR242]|uniref:AMP-binding protein n=1 Tax=Roseateles sp. YR242 TaxID=1855305 RepID=UPI0008B45648|nr:AMP-binding protein [Roseateles sp. YR242]SEL52132.1 amino acid adenylation domain-containing protein [Roseateles sp. YR242]
MNSPVLRRVSREQEAMRLAMQADLAPAHAYLLPRAWIVHGPLALPEFGRAWRAVVQEHPLLTSRLVLVDGEHCVAETICPAPEFRILDVPEGGQWSPSVERVQREAATDPLDPYQALSRIRIYRMASQCHLIFITLHHLIADATAFGQLATSLARAYAAEVATCSLPFEAAGEAGTTSPWSPAEQAWPHDRAATTVLDEALAERLAACARSLGVSRFSVLATAWQLHLMTQVGHTRVQVHYAHRMPGAPKDQVDCAVALRTLQPQLNAAVLPWQDFCLQTWHQLSQAAQPGAAGTAATAWGWGINKNIHFHTPMALPGLAVVELQRVVVNNPIQRNLSVITLDGRPNLLLESNVGSDDSQALRHMLSGYLQMLARMLAAQPHQRVRELVGPLFCPPRSASSAEIPALPAWTSGGLTERLAALARVKPDAIAVEHGDCTLSYRDLDTQTQRCRLRLLAMGVTAGDVVAASMPAGIAPVVLFLALLSMEAVYAPMPATASKDYLESLRKVVAARWVLGPADLDDRSPLPDGSTASTPASDRHAGQVAAYCLTTSGSSGQPKPVLVPQSAIVNLLQDWQDHVQGPALGQSKGAGDSTNGWRHSWWTEPTFDVSIWEMLVPLMSGGTLVIVPVEHRQEARELLDWMSHARIDIAYLPPHVVRDLPNALTPTACLPRLFLTGVEPLDEASVAGVLTGPRLVNGYGPTEATVYATRYAQDLQAVSRRIAIGAAITNTQVRVLDPQLRNCPIGEPGILHISGPGLALGYPGRSRATAAAFVPDPFGPPGSRMYVTGDVGRYRDDGQIEYLRRADRQAKVNGVRVEPDQIEIAAQCQAGVTQARAVVTRASGHDCLTLFVAGLAEAGLPSLQKVLEGRLPPYLRPHQVLRLATFPLTAHGKVDDMALRSMAEQQRPTISMANLQAGLSHVTSQLSDTPSATICAELTRLASRPVSADTGLSSLGLSSLSIITLIERLKTQGISLRFSHFHRCRNVKELAACSHR